MCHKPCYKSCKKCLGSGDSTINNCLSCNENGGYFHYEDIYSINCYNRDEVPEDYYLYDDTYTATETQQSRYWKKCHYICGSCTGGSRTDCSKCSSGYYPKCEEMTLTEFECYNTLPENNYFLNEEKNCYQLCDVSCETCDKEGTSEYSNCLSCKTDIILFNRNCYKHCPLTHYELDHKKCVDKCPEYTKFEYTIISPGEYYNQCYNCKDKGKCIYLGSQDVSYFLLNDCIECNAIDQTFISNTDYNILDDCYELCATCSQRGTITQMNCLTCFHAEHCLVEDLNNCVVKGSNVDYYYMNEEVDGSCTYKKCYSSCLSCNGDGDADNNNCIYCAEGYQPDPQTDGNCVKICDYYWYIDETTQKYTCTTGASCPRQKSYLAELTKECVSDCIYAYSSSTAALYKFGKICVLKCPENTMIDNLLYACYSLDNSKEVFSHVQNYISYSSLTPPNLLIYSNDKTKYFHLFNTTSQSLSLYRESAKGVGTSLMDYSYCIATLRRQLGYSRNEIFYIGIMDVIREDTSAPQFEYTIHDHLGT